MAITDFDVAVDRSSSSAEKWNREAMLEHFGREDLLPFWVADMEFKAPPTVCECLKARAENGVFGYEFKPDSLTDAALNWYSKRHGWNIDRERLRFTPGILNAISVLLNLLTEEGDGVIVQPPVFFEFRLAIRDNRRKMVKNPLKYINGHYEMDFEDLEEKASNPRTRMLILCNPHNPVGRVWKEDELKQLGEICRRHGVFVVSDEIHGDFTFGDHSYRPFASISEDDTFNSVTCISPAKTFNIAAVTDSMAVIASDDLRRRYDNLSRAFSLNRTNAFSAVAMETAYRTGEEWLDQLLAYLEDNISFLSEGLSERVPGVQLVQTEGTFLAWLDFRQLGMGAKELQKFLSDKAGLALNSGHWFGREGAGFARMTIACPGAMLEEALAGLAGAVADR